MPTATDPVRVRGVCAGIRSADRRVAGLLPARRLEAVGAMSAECLGRQVKNRMNGPIVDAIHALRAGLAARFGNDVDAIIAYAQTTQEESGRSCLRNPARPSTTTPFRGRETEFLEGMAFRHGRTVFGLPEGCGKIPEQTAHKSRTISPDTDDRSAIGPSCTIAREAPRSRARQCVQFDRSSAGHCPASSFLCCCRHGRCFFPEA